MPAKRKSADEDVVEEIEDIEEISDDPDVGDDDESPDDSPGDDAELVVCLARPGHPRIEGALEKLLEQGLKKMKDHWYDSELARDALEAMIRVGHPRLAELFVRALMTAPYVYGFVSLIPSLPPNCIQPLEEALPSIRDGHADWVAEKLDELQQKHAKH
jgi:hypothetical protein